MESSLLDNELVTLEAYEPAGSSLELTARDLLGHTLVLGGSGTGKTSCLIQPILRQLIQSKREPRFSICMIDTKSDGESEKFIQMCAFSGEREADVRIISEVGAYSLDLLEPLKRDGIEGASKLAGELAYLIPEARDNRYWESTFTTLLRHTFRIFIICRHELNYERLVRFIGDYLIRFSSDEGSFYKLDELLRDQFEDGEIDACAEVVNEAIATHQMWQKLDLRTKSILQSMAAPLLAILNSSGARCIFSQGKPLSIEDRINSDGITVLSVNGVLTPELSRLAGTIFKARYYDAIFQRRVDHENAPSILVLDDWIQTANQGMGTRYSDSDALSLIRSRHGCILAAVQGLAGLDLAVGTHTRRAVLANFANLFFFRSRDSELDAIAAAYLGHVTQILKDRTITQKDSTNQRSSMPVEFLREIRVPAVPAGALARLPTGEAYALIGGTAYNQPISLIPHHKQNK